MIEAAVSRMRLGFPVGPRRIVPVLKTQEMGHRSLLAARRTDTGAHVLFHLRKM